ncbi:LytR/AlgR family response regulator transcription factor [Candidatus Vondammii sp. HM_W22]|uniref:LytR/AlgR family response regulator transcription factor n=1 Tax=Candidatus Vondammii sp. HM_W22 TaxID=2687299 RepID=UPI001F13A7B5|nr:LytTR family DNA-binding domain-containing protein [Candidatus Vondammii sp. HM_W22]
MKILIADDETYARSRLRSLVEELGPAYHVAGEAANGAEAVSRCKLLDIDLVLMDIRMPEMDGLEAAARLAGLKTPPAVIFVTAFEEYALAAFEENAVDYLLKPIRRQRLEKALAKAAALTRPQLSALQQESGPGYISATIRGGLERIPVENVIYFLADHKYVTARHTDGEALLEDSLKALEERFGQRFIRIHRNALVARERLKSLQKGSDGRCHVCLEGSDELLEVSRRHLASVRRLLKEHSYDPLLCSKGPAP